MQPQDLRLIPFTISQQDYANEDTLKEEAEWSMRAGKVPKECSSFYYLVYK